jgi:Ni,Fe-hydrogenase III small subunit
MLLLLRDLRDLRRRLDLKTPARRSLAVRHVDAGSCNGCEHELTAAQSPFYDLARFGLAVTASPRHADVLIVTGAITKHMVGPLIAAYESMPEPRIVAALGDCALARNTIADPSQLAGPLEDILPVTIRISGCPPTPDQIIDGLRPLLDAQRTGTPATIS